MVVRKEGTQKWKISLYDGKCGVTNRMASGKDRTLLDRRRRAGALVF